MKRNKSVVRLHTTIDLEPVMRLSSQTWSEVPETVNEGTQYDGGSESIMIRTTTASSLPGAFPLWEEESR